MNFYVNLTRFTFFFVYISYFYIIIILFIDSKRNCSKYLNLKLYSPEGLHFQQSNRPRRMHIPVSFGPPMIGVPFPFLIPCLNIFFYIRRKVTKSLTIYLFERKSRKMKAEFFFIFLLKFFEFTSVLCNSRETSKGSIKCDSGIKIVKLLTCTTVFE